ncbi:MAG: hypothetical protein JWP97_6509 [Labilithrix sp.]|nr:hypothetical protein [Labilithrix sp.]
MTISTYEDGQPPHSETVTFSTLLDRATGAFRFEYEQPNRSGPTKRAVIWQMNHGPAHLWWTVTGSQRVDALERHIGAQTGVSSGTVSMVPPLLLGRALPHVYEAVGADGSSPLRSLVHRKGESETTLFVSRDGTLRHYIDRDLISTEGIGMPNLPNMTDDERRELEAALRTARRFRIERTVRYEPLFDQPIDPERFQFVPPVEPVG